MPFFSAWGASKQAEAAERAAELQYQATQDANNLARELYYTNRGDQEPWRQAGITALGGMQSPDFQRDFTMSDFQRDPGYDFRMQEGMKALERSAAARGGLGSGGTLKALIRYGQDFASNEYQNAYNRFNNDRTTRFNRLASLAGAGQTATNQVGAYGQNYANTAGQNLIGGASAMGAAGMAGANAWANAAGNIGNNIMSGIKMLAGGI